MQIYIHHQNFSSFTTLSSQTYEKKPLGTTQVDAVQLSLGLVEPTYPLQFIKENTHTHNDSPWAQE